MKLNYYSCDKCKRIMDEDCNETKSKSVSITAKDDEKKSFDLCPSCYLDFKGMLEDAVYNWFRNNISIDHDEYELVVVPPMKDPDEPTKGEFIETDDPKLIDESCEAKCYRKRVALNDFKRCKECGRIAKCPAINDERCNDCAKIPFDEEEVKKNIEDPKGKKAMAKDHGGSHFMWTDKEIKFLKDNYDKLSINEIAYQLGRSYGSVSGKLSLMGLKKKKGSCGSFRTSWEDWEIDLLKEEGSSNTLDELSKLFDNHTKESVRRMMYALGIKWKGKRAYNKKSSS